MSPFLKPSIHAPAAWSTLNEGGRRRGGGEVGVISSQNDQRIQSTLCSAKITSLSHLTEKKGNVHNCIRIFLLQFEWSKRIILE